MYLAENGDQLRVEAAIDLFQERIEKQKEKGKGASKLLFSQSMLEYLQKIVRAQAEGRPLAMISIFFPPEILLSMGLTVFAFEQYTIQLLAFGRGFDYIERGEAFGFSKEACSAHKACVGMAANGIFPTPDILLYTGQLVCDSSAMMAENISYIYQCPTHWLNFPITDDDEAVKHLKRGLEETILFVEKQTGLKYHEAKLRELMERDKLIQDYYVRTQQMRRTIPCTMGGKEAFANFGVRMVNEGLPITLEFMKAQYQESLARLERHQGTVPEERHRVIICGTYPFWYMGLFDWMAREFGAVVVADVFSAMTAHHTEEVGDTSDPLECLARKTLRIYPQVRVMGKPSYIWAREVGQMAREYQCDASIFFASFTCKQTCGFWRVMTDTVREIAGLPSAIVTIDACDPSIASENQIKDQIRHYFQLLEGQR